MMLCLPFGEYAAMKILKTVAFCSLTAALNFQYMHMALHLQNPILLAGVFCTWCSLHIFRALRIVFAFGFMLVLES